MKMIRNPDLVATQMDGDLVMMSVEDGAYYALTGIAPTIWGILEAPHTIQELLQSLIEKYDVEEEILREDLDLFLGDMKKNGLVHDVP